MTHTNKTMLAAVISSFFASFYVHAEKNLSKESVTITVKAEEEGSADVLSKQTIGANEIKDTPANNGNLNDYLQTVPSVRVDNSVQNGLNNGEIKPLPISINGAPSEQTAYMIDGVNINNDIDPTSSFFDGTMGVNPNKSAEQAYFFDANMLAGITVYNNNVPANLGGFTGGAVVAKTRQYSGENHFSTSYRTTRSGWSSLRVDENAKQAMDNAIPNGFNAEFQPVYKKDFFNMVAEYGLTDDVGVVLGFSRRDSNIQQTRMLNPEGETDKRNHTRRSDNILANFNWTPDVDQTLEIGLRYSDYREGKFYATNIDGNVSDTHQAYGSTVRWIKNVNNGTLTTTAAYDKFTDKRDSNSAQAEVINDFGSGLDFELGGYGDSQLTQKNIHLNLDYAMDSMTLGNSQHVFNLGADYRRTQYEFNRDQDVTSAIYTIFDGSKTPPVDILVAHEGQINTEHQDYAIYTQDTVKWGDFTIRPGVRIERDNYLNNTNIAPRFMVNWQALPQTKVNFGLNRYYGRSFAEMKLSGEILKLSDDHVRDYSSIENLKTPYSNELSFGVNQGWSNWLISANYTFRNYKQRIVVKRNEIGDKKNDSFINGDDFNAHIYTLQISNKTPWVLGATEWNATLGADWLNTGRANLDRALDADEMVSLDGKLMTRAQMEKEVNSNEEEWTIRLGLDMKMPQYNITWSNKVYVKAPIHSYIETNNTEQLTLYKSIDFGTHVQWDTRIRWQPQLLGSHQIYFQAELLNVLNQVRKLETGGYSSNEYGIYTPGRQLWLEVGYEF
ncbi:MULTISPECIES: TonB-dependent receptor plug domain-containing protein [Xenorhabdus]|uniref:TonB-dependent receptor plug domain-containing protein n=1 Tax=Xenorhabdus TaxID=626 RepID=UPI00064A110E|nr:MULTISPECIES: TonB-dependent receptor plug domain-containing protein [Xenorhabdus]KLU16693.1 TonB-dependent receptor [Xenorhabdus griffiniae]KOP33554.1 TonB-dependent receptor [Xenorhabdus sp. GDc328]